MGDVSEKPIPSVRAAWYGAIYAALVPIARKHGYALAIHGSMMTDLDLIAVPWTEEAGPPEPMVLEMHEAVHTFFSITTTDDRPVPPPYAKPHRRVQRTLVSLFFIHYKGKTL